MKIYGTFTSKDHIDYLVELFDDTPNSGEQIVIGTNGVFFADDPVAINRDVEDSFTVTIAHTCEITLQTNRYLGDLLFSPTLDRYVKITDTTNSKVVYEGYIQPMTFEQPYVYHLDQFTVNCIDYLGGLEYSKWKGTTQETYATKKSLSDTISARAVLEGLLCTPQYGKQFPSANILYDASIGLTSASTVTVLSDVYIDENVLFGDDYDSLMYNNEIMESLLRYFNLHITQIGDTMYIFNWHTLRTRRNTWYRFSSNDSYSAVTMTSPTLSDFTGAMHADSDNSLTIDDVYAQIKVKDNIKEIEDVITSPFDDSSVGWYYDKQLLMTEYMSGGEGRVAYNAFRDMVMDDGSETYNDNHYENGKMVDHYYQHLFSKNWTYYVKQGNQINDINDLAETDANGDYINQWKILDALYSPANTPNVGLIQFGHIDRPLNVKDNSPQPQLEMTPYIVITLNGNENDTSSGHFPNQAAISGHTKFVEYKSPQKNVTYSPTDDTYDNYLVFSGKMLLQKLQKDEIMRKYGHGFNAICQHVNDYQEGPAHAPYYWHATTYPSYDGNGDGMYYTRRWYKKTYTNSTPVTQADNYRSLQPPPTIDNDDNKLYKYEYSAKGESEDKYYKIPLIECELIIGNKRLIETSWGEWGEDKNPTYAWVTVGEEPYLTYKDDQGVTQSYKATTFTLGIDPAIDDYIIGKEHDIQNTIDWQTMNLGDNTKGTAIKITHADNLVGDLTFRIIGPVFATWKEVSKAHHGWFLWRHTVWDSDERALLSHCENLLIKDFKCELLTNLGNNPNPQSGQTSQDIVYISAEENYPTIKDDIEFDFVTQPSLETCVAIGTDYVTARNAVYSKQNGKAEALTTMYDATIGEHSIPEKLYVNAYYNEYHVPKVLLKGTYHMREDNIWRNLYKSSPLGNKSFYIKTISQSLKWNTAEITFKQT